MFIVLSHLLCSNKYSRKYLEDKEDTKLEELPPDSMDVWKPFRQRTERFTGNQGDWGRTCLGSSET